MVYPASLKSVDAFAISFLYICNLLETKRRKSGFVFQLSDVTASSLVSVWYSCKRFTTLCPLHSFSAIKLASVLYASASVARFIFIWMRFSIMEINLFISSADRKADSACSLVMQIFSRKVVFMLKYFAITVGALSKSNKSEKSGFCVSANCHALLST